MIYINKFDCIGGYLSPMSITNKLADYPCVGMHVYIPSSCSKTDRFQGGLCEITRVINKSYSAEKFYVKEWPEQVQRWSIIRSQQKALGKHIGDKRGFRY